jgi:hypothetical protein
LQWRRFRFNDLGADCSGAGATVNPTHTCGYTCDTAEPAEGRASRRRMSGGSTDEHVEFTTTARFGARPAFRSAMPTPGSPGAPRRMT